MVWHIFSRCPCPQVPLRVSPRWAKFTPFFAFFKFLFLFLNVWLWDLILFWYSSRKDGPWVVFVQKIKNYYQQCFELPSMYKWFVLDFPYTCVFLDNGIMSSPNAYSLHDLRFLSPVCGLSTNPNQGPSSWSFSSSLVYFVVVLRQG